VLVHRVEMRRVGCVSFPIFDRLSDLVPTLIAVSACAHGKPPLSRLVVAVVLADFEAQVVEYPAAEEQRDSRAD